LAEFGGKLSSEERRAGQRTLSEGESAARSDDPEEVRVALEAVEMLGVQITSAMMDSPDDNTTSVEET